MKIISVVGARPNFMKVAPFIRAIQKKNVGKQVVQHLLLHTGQHYDDRMSQQFFEDLKIPEADINLGIGSGSHAEQVGYSMIALEQVFEKEKPDWVVVYGDVNATIAASVAAKKLNIKVCHVEAGLRSGDITMPEEVNRLVTDRLSDLLLTPDRISVNNLKKEGVPESAIHFVGNIMIDTLEANRERAVKLNLNQIVSSNSVLEKGETDIKENDFALMTLHRPSNVDEKRILSSLVDFVLKEVAPVLTVIWSVHPRTEKQLKKFDLWDRLIQSDEVYLVNPLGYHEMLRLNMLARIMLTDSGGLQEECTVLALLVLRFG